jgi:hypothetical protein
MAISCTKLKNPILINFQLSIVNYQLLFKPAMDSGIVVRADTKGTGGKHTALGLGGLGTLLVQDV